MNSLFSQLTPHIIHQPHLVRVMGDMSDGDLFFWTNHQATPFFLCHPALAL